MNLRKCKKEVEDIVIRNNLDIDLNNVFVFSCLASLGNFCFYRLDEGENPPVYIFIEGDESYKRVYNSFVDFIKAEGWYVIQRNFQMYLHS
ncbi:MAG: SMI1/KNR4 family protein [Flavisolibacter sp.]